MVFPTDYTMNPAAGKGVFSIAPRGFQEKDAAIPGDLLFFCCAGAAGVL